MVINNMNNIINIFRFLFSKLIWLLNYPVWVIKYLRIKLGLNILRDIKILSIEFSSVCNLRCKYCYLDKLDRPKTLDIAVYEKLIKEVSENPEYNIQIMEWPISGEFFVYPKFREVISITKHYMDQNPRFRPWVILNENLILMDEERMDLILRSGVVKQLICSIDGHDKETFEDMRPPAKFDVIAERMRVLKAKNDALGHPVHIQVNNGRDHRSFGKEFSKEMKEIIRLGNSVTSWHPEFWNESFNKPDRQYDPAKGFCSFVFNNVTLSSSGFVSKCCMDLRGQTEYADLRKDTLKNIWHSQARKQFLTNMFRNKRSLIKGCGSCSITQTNNNNKFDSPHKTVRHIINRLVKGREYFFDATDGYNGNDSARLEKRVR